MTNIHTRFCIQICEYPSTRILAAALVNLQNDMQDMKRKNADETEESGKETRMDSSTGAVVTVSQSESTMRGNDADKNIVSKYKRPENALNLQIPKVEQILWRVLDRASRSVDVQLQKSMDNMAKCQGPTTKMLEIFLNPSDTKKDMKQLWQLVMDSLEIMAHCFADNIHERRERIKKETHLKPRMKSILAEAKPLLHCCLVIN